MKRIMMLSLSLLMAQVVMADTPAHPGSSFRTEQASAPKSSKSLQKVLISGGTAAVGTTALGLTGIAQGMVDGCRSGNVGTVAGTFVMAGILYKAGHYIRVQAQDSDEKDTAGEEIACMTVAAGVAALIAIAMTK